MSDAVSNANRSRYQRSKTTHRTSPLLHISIAMAKGRIVFLHGFTQSSSIFYAKTSALRKKLVKLQYDVIYLNAPLRLTPADFPSNEALSKFGSVIADQDEETNYRAWWVKNTGSDIDLKPAFDTIHKFISTGEVHEDEDSRDKKYLTSIPKDDVPIVGLVGFSQGAAFAGLVARQFKQTFDVDLKFVVAYSGFKLPDAGVQSYYEYAAEASNDAFKMLNVLGELDTVVEESRSLTLYEEYKSISDLLKHPGGHFVPNSKMSIDQVVNWIENSMTDQDKEESKEEDDLDALMDMMDNLGKA